jgi:integrase
MTTNKNKGKDKDKDEQGLDLVLEGNAYDRFYNSLKTKATRTLYPIALRKLMTFLGVHDVNDLLPSSPEKTALTEAKIIEWVVFMKDVENIAPQSVATYLACALKFFKKNHVRLNEDDIRDYLPAVRRMRNTRGYTREEIAKLLHFCGPRETALVLTLAATGMRIEAVSELRMKHLQYIDKYKLYRITVYELDPHEYICFTTPEAAAAINRYIEFRITNCEVNLSQNPDAPLFREEFNTNEEIDSKDKDDLKARYPKAMRPEALGDIIRYRLQRAGIVDRIPLQESQRSGQKRNLIPRSHGFRRFVITTMINKRINETIRNLLTDHSVKLDKDYYYPTEEEKLAEYLKVVNDLTINEENRLKLKVEELTTKTDKLDMLAAEVARLSKRMDLDGARPIDNNKEKENDILDNITEELRFNLGVMEYYDQEDRICCSCGIKYARYVADDDPDKGDWYPTNGHKTVFECHRCHVANGYAEDEIFRHRL